MKADLDAAREALEQGRSKQALRLAWSTAISSITSNDRRGIDGAIEVAEAIRDRSKGRMRADAAELAVFAAYARDNPQSPRLFGVALGQREDRSSPGSRLGD